MMLNIMVTQIAMFDLPTVKTTTSTKTVRRIINSEKSLMS